MPISFIRRDSLQATQKKLKSSRAYCINIRTTLFAIHFEFFTKKLSRIRFSHHPCHFQLNLNRKKLHFSTQEAVSRDFHRLHFFHVNFTLLQYIGHWAILYNRFADCSNFQRISNYKFENFVSTPWVQIEYVQYLFYIPLDVLSSVLFVMSVLLMIRARYFFHRQYQLLSKLVLVI